MLEVITIFRITIGGCRNFEDYNFFKTQLNHILTQIITSEEIIILTGHCSGTDLLAEKYATENGFPLEIHPARWQQYGRGAGVIRNKEMVIQSDLIIAFWDAKSRGTKSLINIAIELSKPLKIIYI